MFISIARVLTDTARVPFRMPWTTLGEIVVVTEGPLTYNRDTLCGEDEIAVWRARCMTNLAGFRQKIRLFFLRKFNNIF